MSDFYSDIFNKPICVEFFKAEGNKGHEGDKGPIGNKGETGNTGLSYDEYIFGRGYGTCGTNEDELTKEVTILNYDADQNPIQNLPLLYKVGGNSILVIRFLNKVLANSKLNVNSSGDRDIYHRGEPIKDDVIFANTTATFMLDGERYNLISVDYNDYSFLPYNNIWKFRNQSGCKKCWTRVMQNILFDIDVGEVIKTYDFPFEFDEIPIVYTSIFTYVNSLGTYSVGVIEIDNKKVTFKINRSDTTRSMNVGLSIIAEA